jgi:TM2 domain-containing membrane protein YozV
MRTVTKLRIGIVLLWAILVKVMILWGDPFLIVGISVVASSALFMSSDTPESVENKKRNVAEFLRLVPGAGQIYLGRRRRSIPFLMFYFMMLFIFYLVIQYPPAEYPSENRYIWVGIFLPAVFFGTMMSSIDIDKLCYEMRLPYENGSVEEGLDSYYFDKFYFIVTAIIAVYSVLVTLYCYFYTDPVPESHWIYAGTILAWTIGVVWTWTVMRRSYYYPEDDVF